MVRVQKNNVVLSVPRADWEHYKRNGYKPLSEELIVEEKSIAEQKEKDREELDEKVIELIDELKSKDEKILALEQEIASLVEEDYLDFSKLSIEELKEFAKENNIDLGQATSESGIIKKIEEHLEEPEE